MALNRNFRTTYYKTLGVPVVPHIVDVEASYAALFGEQVINLTQLTKLALEFGLLPAYRRPAWQLLSGIFPVYRGLWEFAAQEKQEMYVDIVEAAKVLHVEGADLVCDLSAGSHEQSLADSVDLYELSLGDGNDVDSDGSGGGDSDGQFPRQRSHSGAGHEQSKHAQDEVSDRRLVQLQQVYWCSILVRRPLRGMDDEYYLLSLTRVISEVLGVEMERFWCFVRVLEVLHDGLDLLDPDITEESFYDISVTDFENIFIRTLECIKSNVRG
ncbi:TPA: hypothetical protein N0F65_003861 [Lagenidium giganteum]|uniref:Uncharacterized protein n=1 Tax=Lagenidium giganteum TaxID=4803 RepID=A0AAV2ZA01_9STRA|nr:TPA: hypothetical protein N0F65_003861 [Lagenidium giganteum]